MKTYEDLIKQIALDKELFQEFRSTAKETQDRPEEFVAWAKEKGYAITVEELFEDRSDSDETSDEIPDEELDSVTGGTRYPTIKAYKPGGGTFYCNNCKKWWKVSPFTHDGTMGPPYGCPGYFPTPEWEYWVAYWQANPSERYPAG